MIAFADDPRVQFNDQGERSFRRGQELFRALGCAHLCVQYLALPLGSLALAPGFPIQRGGRQFQARQSLQHGAGFRHRQLAGRQPRHLPHQDPQNCSSYGNKEVDAFLYNLMNVGATRGWRELIREATGEDLSSKAMLEYYASVMKYLQEQNKGRNVGWGGRRRRLVLRSLNFNHA